MPNYQNGKIYTIRCRNNADLIYVGSTTQSLCYRFSGHKRDKKCSLYKYIDENCNGNWCQFYIELYEEFKCENKEQLNKREGEVQRQIATINKCIAGRTKSEYYEENQETILEKQKKYYEDNKETLLEQKKIYREDNKDILKEKKKIYREENIDKISEKQKKYYEENIDKFKKYYEDNIDKILEQKKKYYEDNQEQISEKKKEKLTCECGCEIRRDCLLRHQRSKKHLDLIANIQSNIPVLPE
jgi:hypothetical protein